MIDHEPLSPAGMRRRDAMRRDLKAAIPRLHRRRRRRRAAAAASLMIAATAAMTFFAPSLRFAPSPIVVQQEPPKPGAAPAAPDSRIVIEYVPASPGIVDRYAATATGLTVFIDDDALVMELAAMDRPTGLVRRGDRVWLTADVLDEL